MPKTRELREAIERIDALLDESFFGHKGRPGHRGGSAPAKGGAGTSPHAGIVANVRRALAKKLPGGQGWLSSAPKEVGASLAQYFKGKQLLSSGYSTGSFDVSPDRASDVGKHLKKLGFTSAGKRRYTNKAGVSVSLDYKPSGRVGISIK